MPTTGHIKVVALLLAAAVLVALVFTIPHRTRTADFSWNYDYVRDPPCTNSRTRSCVKGFNVSIGAAGFLPKPVFVPQRFDDNEKIGHKTAAAILSFESYGQLQFCVTSVGADASGAPTESSPICVTKFLTPPLMQVVWAKGELLADGIGVALHANARNRLRKLIREHSF